MEPGDESASSAGPAESPGTVFGPYRILREIGRGAMGIVYEALHVPLDRTVALKVMSPGAALDEDHLARFQREAKAAAQVAHDHIVPVHDAGEIAGRLYFTMPVVAGGSLEDLLREVAAHRETPPGAAAGAILTRRGFPPALDRHGDPALLYARRVAAALAGVASALHAVHSRGMFHRDVKPSNLLIGPNARLLVADFGLVRGVDAPLTEHGAIMGTPPYMSPEQWTGAAETLDGRSDVYSLGAVLFQCMALRPPHATNDLRELLDLQRSGITPSLHDVSPRFPADLVAVTRKALAARAEARYPSAQAFAEDLTRFAQGRPVQARPIGFIARAGRHARRRWREVAAASALLLAVGLWWWFTPGTLSLHTHPSARVRVDGSPRGTAPIEGLSLRAGRHVLRLEAERFLPVEVSVEVARGSANRVERVLVPADPGDAEAYDLVARSLGFEVARIDVARTRGLAQGAVVEVLFPRGRTLAAPRTILLWVAEPVDGFRAELLAEASPSAPVHAWPVELPGGWGELTVPENVGAQLDPGGAYAVRLIDDEGEEIGSTDFTVLRMDEAAFVGADVARRLRGVGADHPTRNLLTAEILLSEGLFDDAFRLAHAAPGSRTPGSAALRLRLLALQGAGLERKGPWASLVNDYLGPGDTRR